MNQQSKVSVITSLLTSILYSLFCNRSAGLSNLESGNIQPNILIFTKAINRKSEETELFFTEPKSPRLLLEYSQSLFV